MSRAPGEPLAPVLATLRDTLAGLGESPRADVPRVALFMEQLVDLGLLLSREPELRVSPALQAFLEDSRKTLDRHLGTLRLWRLDYGVALSEPFLVGDEWLGLAYDRSALAFLFDLYADAPWIKDLDSADELDGTLRERCERDALLDPSLIPDRMPREHWWWWCPQQP
jgi:hypothetical protein